MNYDRKEVSYLATVLLAGTYNNNQHINGYSYTINDAITDAIEIIKITRETIGVKNVGE
jgi:hypothetical protein